MVQKRKNRSGNGVSMGDSVSETPELESNLTLFCGYITAFLLYDIKYERFIHPCMVTKTDPISIRWKYQRDIAYFVANNGYWRKYFDDALVLGKAVGSKTLSALIPHSLIDFTITSMSICYYDEIFVKRRGCHQLLYYSNSSYTSPILKRSMMRRSLI